MKYETGTPCIPNRIRTKLLVHCIRNIFVSSTASLLLMGQMAHADTSSTQLETLKNQVELLMKRIDQLETEQLEATSERETLKSEQAIVEQKIETVPANVVTAGDTPGSFKLPGSNTSIELSGYIKADFIYDLDQDVGDSFAVSAISTDDDASDSNHFRAHARQSRLRVRTNTDLGNGDTIKTHLEGDFFGSTTFGQAFSNSTNFRLRHAYADYGSDSGTWTAGQTWTLFGGFNYAPTVDFFAPNGQVFVRQTQLRWTSPSGWAISLENPETLPTGALSGGEGGGGDGKDELPDLVLKYTTGDSAASGAYSASAVLRQLGVEGTTDAGVAVDDEEFGWGVHLGGDWDLGQLFLTGGIAFGEGVGRYILADGSFNNDVYVDSDGGLEAIQSYGLTLGASYSLTDTSSINFNYGRFENDDPDRSSGVDTSQSYHLNYMWNPWPSTTLGLEVIYGDRELADGSDGDATRLQFGIQRNF